MPCPFHDGGENNGDQSHSEGEDIEETFRAEESRIERREFMKSALVIGGTSALSTVTTLYGIPETAAAESGAISIAARKNRQHAWDRWETTISSHQQTVPPAHHLILLADYDHDGTPSNGHRQQVANAFNQIEQAFEWSHEGVLFTVGYSLQYFRRWDNENLPAGLDPEVEPTSKPGMISAQTLIDAEGVTLPREDPAADEYDVCIHLASDHVQNLLAVEAALWRGKKEINGVTFTHTLDGIFTKPESYPERRVGFAGHEALEEKGGEEDEDGVYPSVIPDENEYDGKEHPAAELSMGFNDQYRNSIPRETDATILEDQKLVDPKPPGVFAQGTIQHVSKLDINLTEGAGDREGGWYDDHDLQERRQQMFSPEHTAENTGEVGEELGNSNAPGDTPMRDLDSSEQDVAELTDDHAKEKNRVGHAQKTARVRFDIQDRITDEGLERLSTNDEDRILPADEAENTPGTAGAPHDDLPGHDGQQEAEQVILRRDVDTVDQQKPGNHFIALMRFAPYMVYMRRAMNGVKFDTTQFGLNPDGEGFSHDGSVSAENSGILDYLTTHRRGNFLVPPITLRALPHPRGEEVEITVSKRDGTYVVTTEDLSNGQIDTETARFGWFYDVNRGIGAHPSQSTNKGGALTLEFPADKTGIDSAPGGPDGDSDVRLRLFAKRSGSRRPVQGTANLQDVTGTERNY